MGFSLLEMREVLQEWWTSDLGPDAMDRLRGLFLAKLRDTRDAIDRSRQLERELMEGLAYLETCKVCPTHEPVSTCVRCSQDHGMQDEPALLKGLMTDPQGRARPSRPARPDGERPGFVRLDAIVRTPPGQEAAGHRGPGEQKGAGDR